MQLVDVAHDRRQRVGDLQLQADAVLFGRGLASVRSRRAGRRAGRTARCGGWLAASSMRESDSRSSTRRAMRAASSAMISRNCSRAFGSCLAGPRRVSMKPWIEASGVLISWLALATKSERIRSIITCSVCSRSAISTPWPPSPRSTGSMRALNCLARSWVGLKVTLLAAGAGERAGDRRQHARVAQHPDQWHGRRQARSKLRRRGRVGLTHGQRLVDHQDRVGQGLDDRARASAAAPPSVATGGAAAGPARPPAAAADRRTCRRYRPDAAAPGRAAGARSRRRCVSSSRRRARARKAPTTKLTSQASTAATRADHAEGGKPGQRQAGRRAPDQALAQERTIAANWHPASCAGPPRRSRRPSCPSWPSPARSPPARRSSPGPRRG